jgi:UDP-N-acetylmuramate--alanine ligase
MNLQTFHSVYLLGIGGIGMSALARYFKKNGSHVSGYDKTSSDITDKLIAEGIPVHFDENETSLNRQADLFIYTPAIPKNHKDFERIRGEGKEWFKRSQVLEWITQQAKTIAVGGTHGKTTTSAFLTHLLHECQGNISGFVGGIMTNYDSNLIASNDSEYIVVEADEYDRSFLRLKPKIAIITSLDPDHLDIYGTFEAMIQDFQTFASRAEKRIVHARLSDTFPNSIYYSCQSDPKNSNLIGSHSDHRGEESLASHNSKVNYTAENISVRNGSFHFEVFRNGEILGSFSSQLPGRHNVENALAAIATCAELNIEMSLVENAVASFRGVHRRFERAFDRDGLTVDDYAHHPKEIESAINAARELYPNRKLTVAFQPHLFSRTRDLESGFVGSLNRADEVILLPIYPAREEPIEGVSSTNLLNRLTLKTKLLVEKTDLVNAVLSLSPETVLVLGAGDIDRLVTPLVEALENWTKNVE